MQIASGNDHFVAATAAGLAAVTFAAGFLGAFDPIEVNYETLRQPNARSSTYFDVGSDATATINGRTIFGKNRRYVVEQDGVEIELRFADGFSGDFDAFTVAAGASNTTTNALPLGQSTRERVRSALAGIFALASGGERAGLGAQAGNALNSVLDALSRFGGLGRSSAPTAVRSLAGSGLDGLL